MSIAIFPIILIILTFIGLIIYYFSYKNNINEALEEDDDEKRRVKLPSLLEVGVLLMSFALLSNVLSMSTTLNNMNYTIRNLESEVYGLRYEIRMLNADSEKIDFNIEIKSVDYEKRTADVEFSVRLKRDSNDVKVFAVLDEMEIELKNTSSGKYTASTTLDLLKNYGQVVIKVSENGSNEYFDADMECNILYMGYPLISSYFESFAESYGKDSVEWSGHIGTYFLGNGNNFTNDFKFETIDVNILLNGDIIKSINIGKDVNIESFEECVFKLDKIKISTTNGDAIKFNVTAIDNYGYTQVVEFYNAEYTPNGVTSSNEWNRKIYDSENNLIFNEDF